MIEQEPLLHPNNFNMIILGNSFKKKKKKVFIQHL